MCAKEGTNLSRCLTEYVESSAGGCRSGMYGENQLLPVCKSKDELQKLLNITLNLNTMNENQVY